jgi:glycosyltransferase involved in cell wall biosynthesis
MSVYALNLLRQLVAGGHDVTMVSQYRDDPTGTRVYGGGPPPPVEGVTVIGRRSLGEEAFAEPGGADFERDVADMVDTIVAEHRKKPFDVLHAQYGYPNGWAVLLAARELGVPTVVSIQGGDGHWVGSCCETHRQGMLRVLDHANALLIGCESFAGEVVDRLGTPRGRFTIVPGAVDVHRFHPAPGRTPGDAPGGHEDPVRLLYHGRVDRRKGALDFLDALAILRAEGTTFAATISGIGPDLDACRERMRNSALGVRFTAMPITTRRPALYRGADVFVSPRPMPRASRTRSSKRWRPASPACPAAPSGVMDCLRHDDNGLLSDPATCPALTEKPAPDRHRRALRRRLAATALEECRRTYSGKPWARRSGAIYEALRGADAAVNFDVSLPRDECRFRAHAPPL